MGSALDKVHKKFGGTRSQASIATEFAQLIDEHSERIREDIRLAAHHLACAIARAEENGIPFRVSDEFARHVAKLRTGQWTRGVTADSIENGESHFFVPDTFRGKFGDLEGETLCELAEFEPFEFSELHDCWQSSSGRC